MASIWVAPRGKAGTQFRRNIQAHGEAIYRALAPAILLNACQFWVGDDLGNEVTVRSAADLRAWAANKTLAAGIVLAPDDRSLRRDDLPGEVLLTFDRLLPLFVSAAEADPLPHLVRRNGSSGEEPPYDPASFHRETYLTDVWLDRVLSLLRIKKQLVLQGVPGTGKTHVAALPGSVAHARPSGLRSTRAVSPRLQLRGIRRRYPRPQHRDGWSRSCDLPR